MKTINEILTLIERFFEGDTTLEEERWLYDYFRQTKELPEELKEYRETFLDFDAIAFAETTEIETIKLEPELTASRCCWLVRTRR